MRSLAQLISCPHFRITTLSKLLMHKPQLLCSIKVMNIRENSLCPLCDEDDETSVHLLGNCPATMVNRNALMGACTLTQEDLRGFHWSILLRFAKNSGRC